MKLEFSPHVAFKVNDYANAVRFYRDVMGLNVLEIAQGSAEFKCGPITFYPEERDNSALYFEFRTDNLEAAKGEFIGAGCRIEPGETGENFNSFYVHDPYGFAFHVYEEKSD